MSPPNNPREFWNPERLQEAAISELRKHGGSESDVRQLMAHFRKAVVENSSRSGIPEA
jgi:hypothetical protein